MHLALRILLLVYLETWICTCMQASGTGQDPEQVLCLYVLLPNSDAIRRLLLGIVHEVPGKCLLQALQEAQALTNSAQAPLHLPLGRTLPCRAPLLEGSVPVACPGVCGIQVRCQGPDRNVATLRIDPVTRFSWLGRVPPKAPCASCSSGSSAGPPKPWPL